MKKIPSFALAAMALLLFAGCQERETQLEQPKVEKPAAAQTGTEQTPPPQAETPQKAVAEMKPTEGNNVTGTVTFTREQEGIRMVADLQGLTPGKHGIHVHETGDCSAPDASSAGGHYNPQGTPHGAPSNPPDQRHLGDLGNLEAGPDGTARYEITDQLIQLEGEQSIVGKAVVVHAGADDFTSQPAGDSGPRVACGVIKAPQPGQQ